MAILQNPLGSFGNKKPVKKDRISSLTHREPLIEPKIKPLILFISDCYCGVCVAPKVELDNRRLPNIAYDTMNNARCVRNKNEHEKHVAPHIVDISEHVKELQFGTPQTTKAPLLPHMIDPNTNETIIGLQNMKVYLDEQYPNNVL